MTTIRPDLAPELHREGFLRRVVKSTPGLIGLLLLGVLIAGALLGWIGVLPHDPLTQNPESRMAPPSAAHWFGTDQFGRDLVARTMSAVGNSALIAIVSVGISAVIGTLLGLLAGYYRKISDVMISGLANVLFAFPPLLLALALVSVLARNWFTVALAISVVFIPIFVRTARAATLSVREVEFIKASISTGQHSLQTIFRHVLPNILPLVVMQIALALSWAVLTEAALSFLQLGTPPPAASLGSLIFDARITINGAPWTMIAPGVVIIVLVVAINLVGDGLRDALDPKGRR